MPNEVAKRPSRFRNGKGQSERDRLAEGERMLVDRAHGMTLTAIAEKYNVHHNTVGKRLKAALDARIATTVDAYREQQNASLDHLSQRQADALELVERSIGEALRTGRLDQALGLLDRLERVTNMVLRIQERRARLNGLDRPQQMDVTVTEVTEQDRELAEMIREAQARMANTVEDLLG